MSLHILSVQHDRQGLVEVARASRTLPHLAATLRDLPGVAGLLPLTTCNRVELVVDAPSLATADLRGAAGDGPAWDEFTGEDAVAHLFRVAAGLESMVVGEREIAGQVRRALGDAQDAGSASTAITICVEEALRTSRRVARETDLAAAGRSVVSVALELAGVADWSSARVLLVGTGSYAGASVAAARARGAVDIRVNSASGRGAGFAAGHGLVVAPDLRAALQDADVVITCRGVGRTVTPGLLPQGAQVLVDLALQRDVDPAVADLPGKTVVDLASVQAAVAPDWSQDTDRAGRIVAEGIAGANAKLRARVLDPAVVELRDAVLALVADEVERLPQGRTLTRTDTEHALRRLATRLLHVPSMRARQAAATGRTQEYLEAMAELYGIGAPDRLEEQLCPVTGLGVDDLADPVQPDRRNAG